jgi:hypothetical protein
MIIITKRLVLGVRTLCQAYNLCGLHSQATRMLQALL